MEGETMLRSELIRPISELLVRQAETLGTEIALRDEQHSVSFRQLADRSRRFAGSLRASGIQPGDRVAIYMANGTNWAIAMLGTICSGAIGVAIPAKIAPAEADFMLTDSGASAVVVDAERLEIIRDVLRPDRARSGTNLVVEGTDGEHLEANERRFEDLVSHGSSLDENALDLDSDACIIYTSGTSGRPKGVLLSQRNLMWVVAAGWVPFLEWTTEDLILCPLPMTHSYPLDAMLAALVVGATHYMTDGFSAAKTLEILENEDVTVILAVPTILSYLANELTLPGIEYTRRTLRMCISAGAVLAADTGAQATELLGAPILDAYGATEAATAITMCSLRGDSPAGSCGVSLPAMAVRVVDPVTDSDCAPNEEGEIIARGPGIMRGYFNRPAETEAALRGGWYRTGDLGSFDRHGNLTISGRLKDVIIRGGENISPGEIENVVIQHPGVADCVVIGEPHEFLGEVPLLVVVPAASVDVESLPHLILQLCQDKLAPYKQPERVVVLHQIPRTGSGKAMRHRLRETLGLSSKEPR